MGARSYTVAVGAAVLVGGAGCWTAARTSTSAADSDDSRSNVGASKAGGGEVVVRMAKKNEFPDPPPPPPPPSRQGRRINLLGKSCDKSGPTVRAYFKPVVGFARQHLLGEEHGDAHEVFVANDADDPTLEDGVSIVVAPRARVGQLRIVSVGPPYYAPGERWAETSYCLHVLHQGARTTIAVEVQSSMIR